MLHRMTVCRLERPYWLLQGGFSLPGTNRRDRENRMAYADKCSSVTQAIERLDPSFEAVALLDAHTMPHRSWLRELVAPPADESVGAATGNRWYMPGGGSWGALVRYSWNAADVGMPGLARRPGTVEGQAGGIMDDRAAIPRDPRQVGATEPEIRLGQFALDDHRRRQRPSQFGFPTMKDLLNPLAAPDWRLAGRTSTARRCPWQRQSRNRYDPSNPVAPVSRW
jgi:hypothetical protein